MPCYFLKIAYRGTAYHGWQVQENAHTVQAELNEKIGILTGQPINVVGCGRTDTGVHAREFYLHLDMEKELTLSPVDFVFKLNRFLPEDIAVYGVWEVPSGAHARFDAVSRTYRYYILTEKDPFTRELAMSYNGKLNPEVMQRASHVLLGRQDFTSFSKLHTQTATNICHITHAAWEQKNNFLIFSITADRFLRNMVRAIVGTLLEIGRGKMQPEEIETIIDAKDRRRAGYSAPAQGLFLERVRYPDELESILLSNMKP